MSRNATVLSLFTMCVAFAGCAAAPARSKSQTRTEVVKATTPHDDAKQNSHAVPEVTSTVTAFERVVVLRLTTPISCAVSKAR